MSDVENALKAFGLEEKEIKTYLALLDLHESTATKISERTGLGRVHTYQIINNLIEKGLASYVVKSNIKFFSAADPVKLLNDLKLRQEQLKNVLPILIERKKHNAEDTRVEIYRGREGINTILKIILRDNKTYYFLGGIEEICKIFRLESVIFVKRAKEQGLKGKLLVRKKDDFFLGLNEEFKYIPDKVIMTTTTWTWGKKTGIFVWKEPYYCILIESEEIAISNKNIFDYLYNIAEKPSYADMKNKLLKD